jgi:elongation factor Ts
LAVTTEMIKDLRKASGAGVIDCKKALEATEGDFDKALEHLREKGLEAAAKKASREANEGRVNVLVDDKARVGAIVEVNCETDFVARTAEFQAFVNAVARQVAQEASVSTVPELLERPFVHDRSVTVGQRLTQLIATLGENMRVQRFARMERDRHGLVEGYLHPGSRIGVLVYVSAGSQNVAASPVFADLVHDLSLQIAAAAPQYVAATDIPETVVEAERASYRAQLVEENKPDQIKERIISGKLDKWYRELSLLRQPFVKDDSLSVDDLLSQKSKELGAALTVERFVRYELGRNE